MSHTLSGVLQLANLIINNTVISDHTQDNEHRLFITVGREGLIIGDGFLLAIPLVMISCLELVD